MKKQSRIGQQEIYLEFIAMGSSVKVSAVDVETGTEVSIVGPASAPQKQLEQNAIAKLRYVLAKKHGEKGPGTVC